MGGVGGSATGSVCRRDDGGGSGSGRCGIGCLRRLRCGSLATRARGRGHLRGSRLALRPAPDARDRARVIWRGPPMDYGHAPSAGPSTHLAGELAARRVPSAEAERARHAFAASARRPSRGPPAHPLFAAHARDHQSRPHLDHPGHQEVRPRRAGLAQPTPRQQRSADQGGGRSAGRPRHSDCRARLGYAHLR